MRALVLCGVLSLMGVFACVDGRAPESDPEEAEPVTESTIESALEVCCTDFTCVPTGFETSGCKGGIPSIAQAYQACNAACAVSCASSGMYCQ
jgi:hypothetical protein